MPHRVVQLINSIIINRNSSAVLSCVYLVCEQSHGAYELLIELNIVSGLHLFTTLLFQLSLKLSDRRFGQTSFTHLIRQLQHRQSINQSASSSLLSSSSSSKSDLKSLDYAVTRFLYEIDQDVKYGNNSRMSALFWILSP